MTRAKDISKIVTDADLSGTLDVTGTVTAGAVAVEAASAAQITITDNSPSTVSLYMGAGNSSVSIGSTTSDPLTFLTANTERMRIDSSGNVGINTTSSVRDLQIGDNTRSASILSLQTNSTGNGSIYFGDNTTTNAEYGGMIRYSHSDNAMLFWTSSTERMRIDSGGHILFGTTTLPTTGGGAGFDPDNNGRMVLHLGSNSTDQKDLITLKDSNGVVGAIQTVGGSIAIDVNELRVNHGAGSSDNTTFRITGGTSGLSSLQFADTDDGNVGMLQYNHSSNYLLFQVNNAERMRIDSSGRVGIGTSSPTQKLSIADASPLVDITSTGTNFNGLEFKNSSGSFYIGQDNSAGTFYGAANARVFYSTGAYPIAFFTDGSNERMRIASNGNVGVGKTSVLLADEGVNIFNDGRVYGTVDSDDIFIANRLSNDGNLIRFFQNNSEEGNISVSGTTISYNGGHLSRWSQLTTNTRDESIVKGTVMTNLDQMAEWTTDGVTEDNEQLNCMAVSSVEGDANVAGVFVNWDNDDDIYTNDMNIAMTGDMVIRIAQGTTVARGDLLMSAGDGTAKPQGDDIVRSKTIAKVTSTNVSHTYDDGTYLVPCVLMAC